MSKTKSFKERLSEWWNPSALKKARNAFDKEMGAALRDATQYKVSKSKDLDSANKINEKIDSAIANYFNNIEQAKNVRPGADKQIPSFTSKRLEELKKLKLASSPLEAALGNFDKQCGLIRGKVWAEAENLANSKNTNKAVEFAKDHATLISTFVALITACAEAFIAHKKDLISLAEVGRNSEGAKLAILAAGFIVTSAGAAKIAHSCLMGNTMEVKEALDTIGTECNNKSEAFRELARANTEEKVLTYTP